MAELKLIQASATLPFPFPDPIEVFDRLLPSHFETQFLVRSPNSNKNWAIELSIKFFTIGLCTIILLTYFIFLLNNLLIINCLKISN